MPAKPERPYFVAIDAGTGSARAAVVDTSGRLVACVRREWDYRASPACAAPFLGYEFDPEEFWTILCGLVREALERSGVAVGSIAGVAATSQREGCVFIDLAGREVLATPSFDSRAVVEGGQIIERIGYERVHRITGHVPPFSFPLPRLLWWKAQFPDRPLGGFLMISDWVSYRLTGERVAEASNAAESLLYDVEKRTWSEEIREAFELAPTLYPRLVSPGMLVGRVSGNAAKATGLREGTPVYAAGADSQCALLGSSVLDPGEAGAVCGTTVPVQLVLEEPCFDTERYLWTAPHVVEKRWVLESNALEGGRAYRWLLDLLGLRSDEAGGYLVAEDEMQRARPEEPVFAYVGPAIWNFNPERMNPARAAGILFRSRRPGTRVRRAELLLGTLEGLVFALRANLEQLEAAAGRTITSLAVSGGMMRSPTLRRLLSAVLPVRLRAPEVSESAIVGCVILAAVGSGVYPNIRAALEGAVRLEELPARDSDACEERYRKWRELYDVLERQTVS